MVLIIRKDLGMRIGKVTAQCVHAAIGACNQTLTDEQTVKWMKNGYHRTAISLKVYSEEEFDQIEQKAQEAGLNVYVQVDAGLTCVEPGSRTVMAIGPHSNEELAPVTKGLKLY
jgi:PTH2 family peptidyl-tRNA hydrolase